MRTLLIAALAGVGLALPAGADPVHGLWWTEPDGRGVTSVIRFADCDDRICGWLVSSYDSQGRPVDSPDVGRAVVWGMEPHGSGRYRDGRRWLPERQQDFPARMDLAGDELRVTHCSMVIFCHERVWTRAD